MKLLRPALVCLLFAFYSAGPALADDVDRVSVGLGYYGVFDNDEAVDFRVDYRPGTSMIWELRPWMGLEVTSDAAVWAGAGFLYDFYLGNNWVLTPSLGAGLYADGNGQDLGSAIEFRSTLEMGYQFENTSRVTAGISHMSNADIGDHNPGTEILSLNYHMPVEWIAHGPGSNNKY